MATEEERAALHRAQEEARKVYEEQNAKLLAGNDVAKAALDAKWKPLLESLRERRRF